MAKYVAFLRGINVGGRIVKMADLKACFEDMGFSNVSTLLQTGNVTFEIGSNNSDSLKKQIERTVSEKFNYPAKVFVYPLENIQKVVDYYPFDAANEASQHYVIFLEPGLAEELINETKDLDWDIEKVKIDKDVVYWQVQKGMTVKSPFSKYLTKTKYKDSNTNRNIKTLKKITAGR